MAEKASYDAWGQVVAHTIFNETSLTILLGLAMQPQTFSDTYAEGSASPKLIGPVKKAQDVDPCEMRFTAHMDVELNLKLLKIVPYAATAQCALALTVRAEAPGTLILDLALQSIDFQGKNNDELIAGVAAALAAALIGSGLLVLPAVFASTEAILKYLKSFIRDQVFKKIQATLKDKAPQCRVDLYKTVRASQSSKKPVPTTDINLPAPLVDAGSEILIDLKNRPQYFDVLLDKGEQLGLMVALLAPQHMNERPDALLDPSIKLDVACYAPDGKAPVWRNDDWGIGDTPRLREADIQWLNAPMTARYRISIQANGRNLPKASVRQRRIEAPLSDGQDICLRDVGHAVLLGALGPDVIADAMVAALSEMDPTTLATTFGPLEITATPKDPMAAHIRSPDDVVRFSVVMTLDIIGALTVDSLPPQVWKALPKARFVLCVTPEVEPLALRMTIEGPPVVMLDPGDVTHPGAADNQIRDAVHAGIVKFLPGIVADKLAAALADPSLQSKLFVNVKDMIDKKIAEREAEMATPPSPPTPLPVTFKGALKENSFWSVPFILGPARGRRTHILVRHRFTPGTKDAPPNWKDIFSLERVNPSVYICTMDDIPFQHSQIVLTAPGDEDAWDKTDGLLPERFEQPGPCKIMVCTDNMPVEFEITISKKKL